MSGGIAARRCLALLAAGVAVLACTGRAALAAAPAVACSATSALPEVAPVFKTMGQTLAEPATMMLADDGSARLLFRQPLTGGAGASIFLVYETGTPVIANFAGAPVPVFDVDEAPADAPRSFLPASGSVQLEVGIRSDYDAPWSKRYFVVVGCGGGQVTSWGLVTARVSSWVIAALICTALALVSYFFWMWSIWRSRPDDSHGNPNGRGWRAFLGLAPKQGAADPLPKQVNDDDDYLNQEYPSIFCLQKLRFRAIFNPIHLMVNEFAEPSVQKFQVILFSFLVAWLVTFIVLRTGTLVDLSATVVGLMGISTIGAASAKIAYQQRTRLGFANWAWLQQLHVLTIGVSKPTRWGDLVMTNREFDIYKMQTIIFSLAVACALLIAGGSNLSTFTVPEALLGILGLSQVTYIGGVLVRPPAVNDLDDALTALRQAADVVKTAELNGADTDDDGKPPLKKIAGTAKPGANARRHYDALKGNIVPMIESTLEVRVRAGSLDLPPTGDPPVVPGEVKALNT